MMNTSYDLFLLLFNLSQLRLKEKVLELFTSGLGEVFKPAVFILSEAKSEQPPYCFEIRTRNHRFGFINVATEEAITEENEILIINAVGMLAVILERLDFESKLQEEKKSFEQLADNRLIELKTVISNLEKEVERRTKSENYLRAMIERSPMPMVITSDNQDVELFNENFTLQFGYTIDDISTTDEWWEAAYPDPEYRKRVKQSWMNGIDIALKKNTDIEMQSWEITTKNGAKRTCEFHMLPLGEKNLIIVNDITEKKKTEAKLLSLVEEKDYLMQELNHRIKNNLNMVSSLISLNNSSENTSLADIKSQIDTICIIHEKLSQADSVKYIVVQHYLDDLLHSIFTSFSRHKINIKISAEGINLNSKAAVPLGMIINEVATNTIKYGFDSGSDVEAEFRLEITKASGNYIVVISNNGKPFPDDIELDNPETLGLRLITSLVKQINGTIELQKSPHPVYKITFPEND